MKTVLQLLLLLFVTEVYGQSLIKQIDSLRLKNSIPEIGFAIIKSDTILEFSVMGYHTHGCKDTATINDLFHIGSNTKAMTAFIAAKLVENNAIKWNTGFFELFPEWKKQSDSAYWEITLQELLSHRARIEPYVTGIEFKALPKLLGSKNEKRTQFCKFVLMQKPTPLKDTLFSYSNAGYTLAALMLEKATGMSWENLAIKTFKTDLGIDLGFSWPNLENTCQPWGHYKVNDSIISLSPEIEVNHDMNPIEPAGDIHISIPEYIKFIQLNLNGLSGTDNYIKSGTYNKLHIDSVNHLYALGWGNKTLYGKMISYHNGSASTFYARTIIDNSNLTAYIVMMNIATDSAIKSVDDIIEKMINKYGNLQYSQKGF
jgi:CubicO group peptidase (beta-lactamase class C family)